MTKSPDKCHQFDETMDTTHLLIVKNCHFCYDSNRTRVRIFYHALQQYKRGERDGYKT